MESKWRANIPAMELAGTQYVRFASKLVAFTAFQGIAMQDNGVTRPLSVTYTPAGLQVISVGSPATTDWTLLMAIGWIEPD